MKILQLTNQTQNTYEDIILSLLSGSKSKLDFIEKSKKRLENMNIEFYEPIRSILSHIGFSDSRKTAEGDVNCRMDVIIVDPTNSIPVEVKSPGEDKEINIKSIRQACENKVVLLSRRFYNTTPETTSLAIAFTYPPERSDVYELIQDIKVAYHFNIGIIDTHDLLALVWDIKNGGKSLNYSYFNTFYGKFEYEKALS